METYKDLLQSVGIETFVKYYEVFKAHRFERSNVEIMEFFYENGETWNKDSANTKASKGKKIFKNGQEKEALSHIINEASKIDDKIKEQAKKLFSEKHTIINEEVFETAKSCAEDLGEKHTILNEEEYKVFFKDEVQYSSEFKKVNEYAKLLYDFLKKPEIRKNIAEKHKLNTSSKEIQKIISPKVQEFGFESEKNGLFKDYQLRPDYYKKLNENTGIIIEVERGKTLANNMDLLDVWKCHTCKEANYLFLIVPILRQTKKGKPTKVYENVIGRLQSFFLKENYINVDAIFIFGY
jgi:hypothetical protein